MSEARRIDDVMREVMRDLFDRTLKSDHEKRADRIEARNRHMRKICEILDMEYAPLSEEDLPA
jgi:hypothetical protein